MNKTVKNIILRISILLGILVFIGLMVLAKINRDNSKIKTIRVEIDDLNGLFFTNEEQVLTTLNNRFDVLGKNLSGKSLEKIEQSLYIIPQVKAANAFTDDQGNLNIKIVQRVPLFRVYNLQGNSFYVDEHKIKFSTTPNFTAKVPIVNGKIMERMDSTQQQIQAVELKRVYRIIKAVQENKVWNALIGQYYINEKNQIELIPRFGTATILVGDDKNIEQRLKQLEIFYFDVLKKVGWNYYKVINIMYKNQVVCLK